MCGMCDKMAIAIAEGDDLSGLKPPPCAEPPHEGTGSETPGAEKPFYNVDQIADYLTEGYWRDSSGYGKRAFDVDPGGSLSVNITSLPTEQKDLARMALESWSDTIGINFVEVSKNAQITFSNENSGAWGGQSSYYPSSGRIVTSVVNVADSWVDSYGTAFDRHSFQTYLHEIGHALGLGHAGDYNGSASFSTDAHYANDSIQMTVMSYFHQTENPYVDAAKAKAVTPMAADIAAIQDLYGVTTIRGGDTIYGNGSDGYLGLLFRQMSGADARDTALYRGNDITLTLFDTGGRDLLDLSYVTEDQVVDLTPGAISDAWGVTGSLVVERSTVIENLRGGSGNDRLIGNDANNSITGGGGADEIIGGNGFDTASYVTATSSVGLDLGGGQFVWGDALGDTFDGIEAFRGSRWSDVFRGDSGDNRFFGGHRSDRLYGRAGDDTLNGDTGVDALYGNAGADTLTGGGDAAQRDRFIYFQASDSRVDAFDTITDFVSGVDRIEISRLDADTGTGGNQAFTLIGSAGFSGTAGELRYEQAGGTTRILADTDGDGAADFRIDLTGAHTLVEGDFLL